MYFFLIIHFAICTSILCLAIEFVLGIVILLSITIDHSPLLGGPHSCIVASFSYYVSSFAAIGYAILLGKFAIIFFISLLCNSFIFFHLMKIEPYIIEPFLPSMSFYLSSYFGILIR